MYISNDGMTPTAAIAPCLSFLKLVASRNAEETQELAKTVFAEMDSNQNGSIESGEMSTFIAKQTLFKEMETHITDLHAIFDAFKFNSPDGS